MPVICWHCRSCPPMKNCPTKALKRNPEGLVYVNEECVGCGKCMETCRVGAIKLHPEKHTPLICDQCGGKPSCVRKCPTKALVHLETNLQRPKLPSEILEKTLRKWRIVA
jgi:carbon-monoxide dehydrogenase iron sulfur subunit